MDTAYSFEYYTIFNYNLLYRMDKKKCAIWHLTSMLSKIQTCIIRWHRQDPSVPFRSVYHYEQWISPDKRQTLQQLLNRIGISNSLTLKNDINFLIAELGGRESGNPVFQHSMPDFEAVKRMLDDAGVVDNRVRELIEFYGRIYFQYLQYGIGSI